MDRYMEPDMPDSSRNAHKGIRKEVARQDLEVVCSGWHMGFCKEHCGANGIERQGWSPEVLSATL